MTDGAPEDVKVTCGICGQDDLNAETIWGHLLGAHDVDAAAELQRWPDGEPVVIDSTLEPGDFGEPA